MLNNREERSMRAVGEFIALDISDNCQRSPDRQHADELGCVARYIVVYFGVWP